MAPSWPTGSYPEATEAQVQRRQDEPVQQRGVDLMLGAAAEVGVDLPSARVVRDRLRAAVDRGMADLDWSALTELADPDAGGDAPGTQPRL